MKFEQFISYYKRKNFAKKFHNCDLKTISLFFQTIKHNLYWKMKLLKQATYTKYVLAKPSKCVQTAHRPPQIPFCRGFSESKGTWN